jgi:hypothetical protein
MNDQLKDAVENATLQIEAALKNEPLIRLRAVAEAMKKEEEIVAPPEDIVQILKNSYEKLDYSLVPLDALEEVAYVLMHGKSVYGEWNWADNPCKWTELLAKAQRHIYSFSRGEDNDPISGRSHIAHAITVLMFLQSYILTKSGEDNRRRL